MISECQNGVVSAHYQTGHPHAYPNVMYMGELAVCKILWDRDGDISKLKKLAEIYPASLKKSLIDIFSFEAGFSLMFAESNADKNDNYYVMAHIVRSISALNQVLFAVNEEYCLNEKKAVMRIDGFTLHPIDYSHKVNLIFEVSGKNLVEACGQLKGLINEVNIILKSREEANNYLRLIKNDKKI